MCRLVLAVFPLAASLWAAGVYVRFDPANPASGPFPSGALTAADPEQITAQRVQLPLPDCDARPSDCAEIRLLNNLDGFHINSRITVALSGAIDPSSLAEAVKIVWLDGVRPDRAPVRPAGYFTAINQIIYDPALYTAYAKPDDILEGARRYLLIVTDALRDAAGDAVEADPAFTACLARESGGPYCDTLAAAAERVQPSLGERRIIAASLFTTQSITSWYEQAREIVNATPPNFQRDAGNPVVPLPGLFFASIRQQIATSGDKFRDVTIPAPLGLLVQGGVRRVAFGSVRSPRFTDTSGSIAYSPSGIPLAAPAETEEIFFHVWLPAGPTPPGGYPVVIAGHGLGDSRFGMPTVLSLGAGSGFAVIAATAFGHGYGPDSSIRLLRLDGSAIEVRAPGRALDLNGDGRFEASEGCVIIDAAVPTGARDCIRQTVVDYLQILHAIRDGIDLDADGTADLNRDNISFVGQSLGGAYGAALTAIAPEIRSVVLIVPPGFITQTARLSSEFRDQVAAGLSARNPALTPVDGDLTAGIPLRNEPVRLRSDDRLADLQDFFERLEWLESTGASPSLAPHLKDAPLPGSASKRVLYQIAYGDRTVPNPSSATLIRAANGLEQTSLYRHDLAREIMPGMPENPHTFLIPLGNPGSVAVGTAALTQALNFLTATENTVPDVNSLVRPLFNRDLFEIPAVLPETLNIAPPPPANP